MNEEYKKLLNDYKKTNGPQIPKDKKDNFILTNKFDILSSSLWIALKNFPKWERNGITIMIKQTIIDFEEYIEHGRFYKKTRKSDYKTAQYKLFRLRRLIDKSYNLKYISLGFYKELSDQINEVGRILTTLLENESKTKEMTN